MLLSKSKTLMLFTFFFCLSLTDAFASKGNCKVIMADIDIYGYGANACITNQILSFSRPSCGRAKSACESAMKFLLASPRFNTDYYDGTVNCIEVGKYDWCK